MADMVLKIIHDYQSDGSSTFGLRLEVGESFVDLDCLNERHAEGLYDSLRDVLTAAGMNVGTPGVVIEKTAGW